MRKSIIALSLSLAAAAAYAGDAPRAKDVAQKVADKGSVSGFSKDLYWLPLGEESDGIFTTYTGAYDFKKSKLYLCESIEAQNDEVITACVTDKGLDNMAGSCFVGRISRVNSLEHVLLRDFDPEYALSFMTERQMKGDDAVKRFCNDNYARMRSKFMDIGPQEEK